MKKNIQPIVILSILIFCFLLITTSQIRSHVDGVNSYGFPLAFYRTFPENDNIYFSIFNLSIDIVTTIAISILFVLFFSKNYFKKNKMKQILYISFLFLSFFSFGQQRKIYGIVKDSIGEIIPGATILIEGTNRGTNTDFDGKYSINANPNEFLIFSFIGKKEQKISANKNKINIQLMDNDVKLIEVLPYMVNINKKIKSVVKNFDFFVRRSINFDFSNLKKLDKWREIDKDTVIYTQYFKGAYCDIPNGDEMKIDIKNDTIIFNFGLESISSDCESEIGVAGIVVDFVLNRKKYPNYKELKIKYITR